MKKLLTLTNAYRVIDYVPGARLRMTGSENYGKVIFSGSVITISALLLVVFTLLHFNPGEHGTGNLLCVIAFIIFLVGTGTLYSAINSPYNNRLIEFRPEGIFTTKGRSVSAKVSITPQAEINLLHIIEQDGVFDLYLNDAAKPLFGLRPEKTEYRNSTLTFVEIICGCLHFSLTHTENDGEATRYTLRAVRKTAVRGKEAENNFLYSSNFFSIRQFKEGKFSLTKKQPNTSQDEIIVDLETGDVTSINKRRNDDVYLRSAIKGFRASAVKKLHNPKRHDLLVGKVEIITAYGPCRLLSLELEEVGNGRQQIFQIKKELQRVVDLLTESLRL